jgi:hypothetical protein
MRSPSSVASAAATSARAATNLGIAFDHKVGCTGIGLGHVLGYLPHTPLVGNIEFARILCPAAIEQGETKTILPAPLRPTKPTFSPGFKLTDAWSSKTLAPRRKLIFLSVIMPTMPIV